MNEQNKNHDHFDPFEDQASAQAESADFESDDQIDAALAEAAASVDSEIASLAKERDELIYELKKATADFHNYVKRSDAQREQLIQFARGDILAKLVPVLDHFDTALTQKAQSPDAQQLANGLKIVRDEFLKVLKSEGLERLDPAVGDPFDPHQHEALMRQPMSGVQPNHVTAVLQPGYIVKGRTIRAAKVAVAPAD